MTTSTSFNVAIIGAGLSGLTLALALHQQNIECTIYEGRAQSYDIGGAMMVMPNGIKVFRALGLEPRLRKLGYSFENANFQSAKTGEIIEAIPFGSEKEYGCKALRIYRSVLLKELLNAVIANGIPVHFNHKLEKVIIEDGDKVEFALTNEGTRTASLLVGADGIHSTVRDYISPGIKSTFQGAGAIFGNVPTSKLGLPEEDLKDIGAQRNKWPLPTGIANPAYGAFLIAPQTYNGDEVVVAIHKPFAKDADEKGVFKKLRENKQELTNLIRENSEHFPDIVQNAVNNVDQDSIIVWPFYLIPHMERWSSKFGRTVIVGDSAHALPPSAGQGLNQALEDVYTLALTLSKSDVVASQKEGKVQSAIQKWEQYRQIRIKEVLKLNEQMSVRRMPIPAGMSREDIAKRMVPLDFRTFYDVDFMDTVDRFLRD